MSFLKHRNERHGTVSLLKMHFCTFLKKRDFEKNVIFFDHFLTKNDQKKVIRQLDTKNDQNEKNGKIAVQKLDRKMGQKQKMRVIISEAGFFSLF